MSSRRVSSLGFALFALLASNVPAGEVLGVLTKVDVEGKKLTIKEKGTEKEVVVSVGDKTRLVSKKGEEGVTLDKLAKGLAKADDAAKAKKFQVKVEEDKGVAVSVQLGASAKKTKTKTKPKKNA